MCVEQLHLLLRYAVQGYSGADAAGLFQTITRIRGDYRNYANAVFVNKTIIVPVYAEQYDTTGLRIWRDAMPGYNVVGVNCDAMIYLGGAVHCITKEVGVTDPLVISHRRLDEVVGINPPAYEVQATIRHKSGIAAASVFYKTDLAAPYQELAMSFAKCG
ncbi:MAG: agmatine deiminase family protein [Lewinellaceae bacterium]|nr:agmatine deiminase family protein [Lewinellaceae bacterium]